MLMCIPDILDWPTIKKIRVAVNEIGFDDGRRRAGRDAKRVKHSLELKTGSEKANEIQVTVIKAPQRNMTFRQAARPFYTHPPLISRYLEGMDYGLHVDDPLMGRPVSARSDVSVTVAISSPDDYDGGELVDAKPPRRGIREQGRNVIEEYPRFGEVRDAADVILEIHRTKISQNAARPRW